MSIEKTYELVKKNFKTGSLIDSLEVVKQVEQYRQFWKPTKTNVVLLAESHVYTTDQDLLVKCRKSVLQDFLLNYPLHFVRFVYCLGYGENDLLSREIIDNPGISQFWKIFSSCVAENENDLGLQKILKTETPFLPKRLKNKIGVLQKMQEKGVWLMDASIVGIYRIVTDHRLKEKIIQICWEERSKKVITEAHPKHVIVIGKNVGDALGYRLNEMGIPFTILTQPQGDRGSIEEQLENYQEYQRICSKYC